MIEQMEESIKFGRKLIDTELDTGILNFIVKPVVKTFYDWWSKHEAKVGTLAQIEITLNAGKELLIRGEEGFDDIVKQYFPKYLKYDQITYQCNKHHKNYERILKITKQTFMNYLKEIKIMLEVKENVKDYGELSSYAFKTKNSAKNDLSKQLDFTDQGIRIIEEDPSILSLAVGRRIIVKCLRKGFEETKKGFFKSIDETYS
jgi:hypothetical protein